MHPGARHYYEGLGFRGLRGLRTDTGPSPDTDTLLAGEKTREKAESSDARQMLWRN